MFKKYLHSNLIIYCIIPTIIVVLFSSCIRKAEYNRLLAKLEKAEQVQREYEVSYKRLVKDSDKDGVSDIYDQELTKPGYRVDVRGVTLDSDQDKVPDTVDKEPFSPPGYFVDSDGVAQVPETLTEADLNRIIDARLGAFVKQAISIERVYIVQFPHIYFNPGQEEILVDSEMDLYRAARVLRDNPEVRILVTGFTHPSANSCQDEILSYRRARAVVNFLSSRFGIDRIRFVLNYFGSEGIRFSKSSLNDRVELNIASNEPEMGPPNCY